MLYVEKKNIFLLEFRLQEFSGKKKSQESGKPGLSN